MYVKVYACEYLSTFQDQYLGRPMWGGQGVAAFGQVQTDG